MAQKVAEPANLEELDKTEADELERLLSETEEGETPEGSRFRRGLLVLLQNKKWLWTGVAALGVLVVGLAVGVYFLFTPEKVAEVSPQVQPSEPSEPSVPEPETVEKINIYQLKPFFLPLTDGDEETGRFILVTPNLLLSNSALNKEVDKVLPQIRKNIYNILRRKRPKDYLQNQAQIETTLKQEILTASNAHLLSGTGTIEDVFYTQFVIK